MMSSFLTRKSSCKRNADAKENAHRPCAPSRSNSKSRSSVVNRSISLLKIPAASCRSFPHMQLIGPTKPNSESQDPSAYGKLSEISSPELTQGDDDNDGHHITEENVHVQRAAACCLATYYNVQEVKELFKGHEIERLNFKEVYLSPLPEPEEEANKQNLLVALAVDSDETSIYIAFRGNSNLAEVFSDVCEPSEIEVFQESPLRCELRKEMGSYHKNFANRLSELVPRIDGLLDFCRSLVLSSCENSLDLQNGQGADNALADDPKGCSSPRTRLVFCGHSLGGALSHLAAVTYLLSIFGKAADMSKHPREDDCMSITFGAPLVFDQRAASFLQTDIPLQNRFFNFFQAKDPVPFILARAPISHQLQDHFQQLKTKNATSLTAAGRSLVDRKLGKFLENQPGTGSESVSSESVQRGLGKTRKARKAEKGHLKVDVAPKVKSRERHTRSMSLPSFEIQESSTDLAILTLATGHGKDAYVSPPVVALATCSSTKKSGSNISKKVSEFGKEVAVYGKEIIRRVTHGGKNFKAKVNMETKRQMWHLESDVKKVKIEPCDEDISTANSFAPFGVYKKLSFHHKTQRHISTIVKPENMTYDFKLRKKNLKQHKIVSYFHCLVGQGSTKMPNQQSGVTIREGPLPRLDKAELVLIRSETSEKLKAARIIAKGKYLSLALEHKCQVTTFSDKWRLVAADSTSIIFETIRATDGKNVYVSQGELIELARVGHGNRVTSISVETVFGRNTGEFCPVLLRDLAADSAVINGLKHSVGKMLVLLETDGPKGGEAGRKILHYLKKAADLTGLQESFKAIVLPTKGTVHAKKTMIDKGFIAQMSYTLCHKPITLVFECEGAEGIVEAAQVVRQQPFTFFSHDRGDGQLQIHPFIRSLNLRTTPLGSSEGQVTIELDNYDKILSCLHALVVPEKHAATNNKGTDLYSEEYGGFIGTYERELYEAMKEFYEGEVLRKDRLMENWFSGLNEHSRASLRDRLELLYFLTSAFKVAKEQKLLALIGPENAGKSTLAKLLGCKSKESTGYTVHTADMKSYRLASNLLAVDFPGTDAPGTRSTLSTIWEAFAKLPDRCIVVTPFTGDVTEGSQQLPRLAAERLCSDVMLLVNRVDGILKGPKKAKIWKQYNKESIQNLHEKFMQVNEGGEVKLKEVMLCCLEEEDLHDSDIQQLKDRGIIFSKEVERRILQWIRDPNASLTSGVTAPEEAVTPLVSKDTTSRLEHQLSRQGAERKSVRTNNYSGISTTVHEASSKSDPESKPGSKPTSHRPRTQEKTESDEAAFKRAKGRGPSSRDERPSGSASSIPGPKVMPLSRENSSTQKLIMSSPESCKSSDHQHRDEDGSSHGNRSEIGHPTTSEPTSPGTELRWVGNQEHTRDELENLRASESSTTSRSSEANSGNDDYRSPDQGDRDDPAGQASSTTTALHKRPKGSDGFAAKISQRAHQLADEQPVQESHASGLPSKTNNQQGSKHRGHAKKSSGGGTPVNQNAKAWR